MQQGDIKLFQTDDGGEVTVTNGIMEMSGGLDTAAYLSLFGGNEDDDGSSNNIFNWWGNYSELNPVNRYRSETQHLLQAIPATTGNLRRVEDAANRDLAWLLEEKIASSIVISVTIPGVNRIKLTIDINAEGEEFTFEFVENWKTAI